MALGDYYGITNEMMGVFRTPDDDLEECDVCGQSDNCGDCTHVFVGPMYLVYRDDDGNRHYQHWADLAEAGTLIDPETGDDMELIGWSTERN